MSELGNSIFVVQATQDLCTLEKKNVQNCEKQN